MERIPAIVRKVADDRVLELALIENIQRKELNPIEEAKAYEVLLDEMKLSHADVARRVGRDRSSISNSLRILKLPEMIQDFLRDGSLSIGHAKVIMAISDAETQIKLAGEVVRNLLSVRETEQRVAEWSAAAGRAGKKPRKDLAGTAKIDPNVAAAADRLTRALATKVRIAQHGERGRIEIEFYSSEELQRLFEFLLTAEKGH